MAKFSRTQMRLGQITGSFGTTADGQEAGAIRDDLDSLASGSINTTSLSGSLSYMASAIRRIAGGDDFSVNDRGNFGGSLQDAYNFHVTGSSFSANQAYTVKSDAGDLTIESIAGLLTLSGSKGVTIATTAETAGQDISIDSSQSVLIDGAEAVDDAIKLNASVSGGGIEILGTDVDSIITIGNASKATYVKVTADSGTPANEIIAITNAIGTVEGAIAIASTAGGVDIDAAQGKDVNIAGGQVTLVSKANVDSTGLAEAISLTTPSGTPGGAADTIVVTNTQGTDEASISLQATAGGVDIDAAAGKDVNISGGQVALVSKDDAASAISLTTNIGADETIVVTNTSGTGAAAIKLLASAGGIDADAAGLISLNSTAGSIEATVVDGQTVNLGLTGGSALLLSPSNDPAVEKASLIVTSGDAADAILLSAPVGGITIGNTGKNVTMPGNLIVNGTTTQINVNELVVEDKVIVMGIPGGMTAPGVATYVISSNVVTVTSTAHGFITTEFVFISDPKDTPVITEGVYVVTRLTDNTFTFAFTSGDNATPAAIDHSVNNVTDVTAGSAGIRVAPASADDTSLTWSDVGWKIGGPGTAGSDVKAGLSPLVDNVGALGSTSLQWADLYLAEEGVINWANGSAVIKEAADILQLSGTVGSSVRAPYLSIDNSSAGVSELRFQEDTDNGAHYVGFKSAAALAGVVVWELPMTAGSANQVLSTNGSPSNQLSWVDAGGASGQVQSGSIGASGVAAAVALTDPAQFKLTLDSSIDNSERGAKISYFVNGQMLLSGTAGEASGGTADYAMVDVAALGNSTATITFDNNTVDGVGIEFVNLGGPDVIAIEGVDWDKGISANASAQDLSDYIHGITGLSTDATSRGGSTNVITVTQDTAGLPDPAGFTKTGGNEANISVVAFSGGANAYATAKFGFDLEAEDVVQVVVR
jgi:hypothetical protein